MVGIQQSVTVVGEMETEKIRLRSGAKPGDVICVTSELGDSGAALQVMLKEMSREDKGIGKMLDQHFRPKPHLIEGRFLSAQPAVHAMMDVSDGLDSDLRHILRRSHCGAVLHLDKIPVSPELKTYGRLVKTDPPELAVTFGEDYCLLFTADPEKFEQLKLHFFEKFNRQIYNIGEVNASFPKLEYRRFGKQVELTRKGYDHFRK